MADTTPIRPRRKYKRDIAIESALDELQAKVFRASALAKVLAATLENPDSPPPGTHPQDSCMGLADLIDGINVYIEEVDRAGGWGRVS